MSKQATVRVPRVIEYTGPRDAVEQQIVNSLHGTKVMGNGVTIKVATVGSFPTILTEPEQEDGTDGNP